jgi:hypothetical protein
MVNYIKGYTWNGVKHMARSEYLPIIKPRFFDSDVVLALEHTSGCIQLRTEGWMYAATGIETLKRQTVQHAELFNRTFAEQIRQTERIDGVAPVIAGGLKDIFLQLDGNTMNTKCWVNLRYLWLLDLHQQGEVFLQVFQGTSKINFWMKTRFDKETIRTLRDVCGLVQIDYVLKENGLQIPQPNYVGKNDCYEAYTRPQSRDPYGNVKRIKFKEIQ